MEASRNDELLERYLATYRADRCYYDWGDDPSFFVSTELAGSPNAATWGSCRPDVRSALMPGDFAVFFCAVQVPVGWDYYYIGVGTVGAKLTRAAIVETPALSQYQRYFNFLGYRSGDSYIQKELIHEYHKDFAHRCDAPYILFDADLTSFQLAHPLQVATHRSVSPTLEVWLPGDERVSLISELVLAGANPNRKLRGTNHDMPHPKLNLKHAAARAGGYDSLRQQLLALTSR